MKKWIEIFILFIFCTETLTANILDKYSQKMNDYHKTLIQGGTMDVVVYSGFINPQTAHDILEKIKNTSLNGTNQERNDFIAFVNDALMKNDQYSKKTLTHKYSNKGYKCILNESILKNNSGEIKIEKKRKETSSFKGLLNHYDANSDTLSISKAPSVDWYSPNYFNFAIVNPMMLDFKLFLIPNKDLKQTIEFIPDGENGIYIKGCVNACEKLHIVIQNDFPCVSDSTYYESAKEEHVLRNIFYRYYQPVTGSSLDLTYPSIVIVIDSQRNNLCRVEMYDITRHQVNKNKNEDDFEIQINNSTKILTDI